MVERVVNSHPGGMDSEPRGLATVRAFYRAFDHRPYEVSIAPFLAKDVVWHVSGENPLAGTFRGAGQVMDAMRRFGDASNHTLVLDTITLLGDRWPARAVLDVPDHLPGAPTMQPPHAGRRRCSALP